MGYLLTFILALTYEEKDKLVENTVPATDKNAGLRVVAKKETAHRRATDQLRELLSKKNVPLDTKKLNGHTLHSRETQMPQPAILIHAKKDGITRYVARPRVCLRIVSGLDCPLETNSTVLAATARRPAARVSFSSIQIHLERQKELEHVAVERDRYEDAIRAKYMNTANNMMV